MANKPTPADFSPNVPDFPSIGQYQPIYGKFDLTTYIQGASDYEIMAFLVQCYNATLKGYGEVTQLSKDTAKAYNQLQTWVNTWFANLDVQQEINNKMQSMYEAGTLANAIEQSNTIPPAVLQYLNSAEGTQNLYNITATKIDAMSQDGSLANVVSQTGQVAPATKEFLSTSEGIAQITPPINYSVRQWLDEHPEATTTVQNGAITEPKIHADFLPYIKKDYVTPEMFGAVGDGVSDDTEALKESFESGKPIVLLPNKTYLIQMINLTNIYKNISVIGNNATIKGGPICFNINLETNKWVHSYPVPTNIISDVQFINNGNEYTFRLGTPFTFKNCSFYECNSGIFCADEYMDYMVLDNICIFNYTVTPTKAFFVSPGLGDQWNFNKVHAIGDKRHSVTFKISHAHSCTFNQCLNINIDCSNINNNISINDSHFESDCNIKNVDEMSNIVFNNCFSWNLNMLNSKCYYNNCTFIFNEMTVDYYNENKDITECYKNMKNCNVLTGETRILDFRCRIILDKDEFNNKINLPIMHNQMCLKIYTVNGKTSLNGTYNYTLFASDSYYSLANCSNYNVSNKTITVNNTRVGFVTESTNKFVWVYRQKDDVIERAIVPNATDRLYDNGNNLSGFKWKVVSEVPTITSQNPCQWTGSFWNSKPLTNTKNEFYLLNGTLVNN